MGLPPRVAIRQSGDQARCLPISELAVPIPYTTLPHEEEELATRMDTFYPFWASHLDRRTSERCTTALHAQDV